MSELRNRPGAPTREPTEWTADLLAKADWRRKAAGQPFRGVATAAGLRPGLVPLRTTGAETRRAARAGEDYLATLSHKQLNEGRLPMDDVSWRHWANGARYFLRHGLCLEELTDDQRRKAMSVIAVSLSAHGYTQVVDLMHLNLTIGELRGEEHLLNEWLYWFTIYGSPETGGPWGWQLDGHHVNVNCVYIGDQMVLTPTFLGAEPVTAESGKYAGTTVFRREEAMGQRLYRTLTARQRSRAVIDDELPHDLFVGAFRDNYELNYEGLPLGRLNPSQRSIAEDLLKLYVDRAVEDQAAVRRQEIREHGNETYFAWVGNPDTVFYYRLHSPVILVEFEHQAGVMYANEFPTRRHIHTVVRTPNGGDYGLDLLRQHHERFHRSPVQQGSQNAEENPR